jgi:adhesin transport system outer membrane protein
LNFISILKDVAVDDKNSGCSEIKALDTIVSVQKKASMEDTTLNELSALLGEEPLAVEEELKEVQEIKVEEPSNLINESEEKKLLSKEFLDTSKGKYTINITTTNGLSLAENFVNENSLELSNTYVYEFGPEMKSAKVIYGIFDSIKEANQAISTLPSSVLGHKPYVDNLIKHQNLYLKYNK